MSRLVGLLLLGMALGALATWAFQVGYRGPPPTSADEGAPRDGRQPPREAPTKRTVHALGTLEPKGGAVLVTSPLIGTPVLEVLVREGQVVKPGERLILLDATVPEEELRIAQTQRPTSLPECQCQYLKS